MPATFKWNEHIIKKQIRSEVEIPEKVTGKAREAYRMIETGQIKQVNAAKVKSKPLRWTLRFAGGLAMVLAASFIICAANPVFAKNLPVIGDIFAQLQDKVSFFGNFTDRATVLEEPEADTVDSPNGVYTKTDDGLTITFSEVYANEQTIYLTMQVKSEEPFPDSMMRELNDRQDPGFSLDFIKKYSFIEYGSGDSGEISDSRMYAYMTPEVTLEDDSTYNCILRLDLKEDAKDYTEYEKQHKILEQQVLNEIGITMDDINDETEQGRIYLKEFVDKVGARQGNLESYIKQCDVPKEFTLSLNLNKLIGMKAEPQYWDSGYTPEELENMSEEEWRNVMAQMPAEYQQHPNKFENFWYEGTWDFDIPITIDSSQTVTLDINETNDDGIGLKSVVKTPYELDVNVMYEEGSNSNVFMVALDADGNKLPYIDTASSTDNFAIQDRDISTVDIYILDYGQYMDELKGEERYNNNENKPVEEKWSTLLDANAKYHKTIHF